MSYLPKEIQDALKDMVINIWSCARPLPIATRGIGFAVALEYSRLCSTQKRAQIKESCTIYQYYRVALYLAYYKMYLAQCIQGEMRSKDVIKHFYLPEQLCWVLAGVTQVPFTTFNILRAIGKIPEESLLHSYPVLSAPPDGKAAALYLYPDNIRGILERLANKETPASFRAEFYDLNPLPGARWIGSAQQGWLLDNPDDIWPEGYGVELLMEDVNAYCNILTYFPNPRRGSFLTRFTWNGYAYISGLVSMDPVPMRLSAEFDPPPVPRRTHRRDERGRLVKIIGEAAYGPVYSRDYLVNCATVVKIWSPDNLQSGDMVRGSATFVGENSMEESIRLKEVGRLVSSISPGSTLQHISNWSYQ